MAARAPGHAASWARGPQCPLLPGSTGWALPVLGTPLGSRAEQGQSSTSKPFPDYPSPEGCFWLRWRLRERGASGFNLTPRGSCHHGFAVRVKDAFTQPRAKAADMETPGHSKAPMSWATLGSSPGPAGKAGAITPCHCSQGGHSEHRSPGSTQPWAAHSSLSAGSTGDGGAVPGDPEQHPGLRAPCQALQTPQGRPPDPERAQAESLCSSRLLPSPQKHREPQEPQKCLLSAAQSLSL